MRSSITRLLIRCYQFLFARRQFYPVNRLLHALSLRGLGVLNFENERLSGETCFLKSYLGGKQESVVLDVGANIGAYAEGALKIQPTAHVYSFEPHPRTFQGLHNAAQRSGFEAVNAGCGSERGELVLYDYPAQDGSAHASLYQGVFNSLHGTQPVEHLVTIITLDDFCRERGLLHIDLLKVDVEGNELKVLLGFQEYLSEERVDAIHFEFNAMNVVSRVFFKDFVELLKGYEFYRLLPNGLVRLPEYDPTVYEIFAFQNIVALRKHRAAGVKGDG